MGSFSNTGEGSRLLSGSHNADYDPSTVRSVTTMSLTGPPPPPPLPGMPGPPPPPPPGGFGGGPPPPPPPGGFGGGLPMAHGSGPKLAQQQTPTPRSKMRKVQWSKIPANNVVGKNNLWTRISTKYANEDSKPDFDQMEKLFSVDEVDSSSKRDRDSAQLDGVSDRKKKSDEVNILDGKRSLNVNIYLRQFKGTHEQLIQHIAEGQSQEIGAEKIKGLLKILPEKEEIEQLKSFSGDVSLLGKAERFLLQLIALPRYELRLEGMLIREEFTNTLNWIKPALDAVILAAGDIKESEALMEIIYMVATAGNFLNAGGYSGDAAGFQLNSLLKLTDTKANKPGINLMHYVAMEAEQKNPELLKFPDEFKYLKEASQYSVESLDSDIKALQGKVKSISEQCALAGDEFHRQMDTFLKDADAQLKDTDQDLQELEQLRLDLAEYFCEDAKSFKLDECLKIFHTFCAKFNKAVKENKDRKAQEEKAEQRRRQREEMSKTKKRPNSAAESRSDQSDNRPMSSHSDGYVDSMCLDDVEAGQFVRTGSLRSSGRRPSANRLHSIEESRKQARTPDDDRRLRKSSEMVDNDLFEYLSHTGEENSDKIPFERTGSLRGRRRRPGVSHTTFDRERVPSPLNVLDKASKPPIDPSYTPFERLSTLRSSGPACSSPASQTHLQKPLVKDELANRRNQSTPQLSDLSNQKSNEDGDIKPKEEATAATEQARLNDEKSKEREKRRQERRRRGHLDQQDWQNIVNKSNAASSPTVTDAPASPTKNIQNILNDKRQSLDITSKDRTMSASQSALNDKPTDTVSNRRWSAMDPVSDINDVIREVEKTGREIERIGDDQPDWCQNSATRTMSGRRRGTDSGFESADSVSDSTVLSPESPSKSSPLRGVTSPLQTVNENSSLTERAMDEHFSGRWKDRQTPPQSTENNEHARGRRNKVRPHSTYDNVPSRITLDKTQVSQSSGDISDVVIRRSSSSSSDIASGDGDTSPVTKRWGRVFVDEKESTNGLKRSNTLPRKWRTGVKQSIDTDKHQVLIEEEDRVDGSIDAKQNSTNRANSQGYSTLESHHSPSYRLGSLSSGQTSEDGQVVAPVRTSARRNYETEQLDTKVQEFQKRSAADKHSSARKAKFQQLSNMYNDTDDDWSMSSKENNNNKNPEVVLNKMNLMVLESDRRATDSGNFSSSSSRPNSLGLEGSPRCTICPEDAQKYSDSDSVVSGRDEGFESESISDPSVSQRTSMSSNLDSEFASNPYLGDKEYRRRMEDDEDDTCSTPLLARSIDSLVNKSEFVLSGTIDIDSCDNVSTSDSKDTRTQASTKKSVVTGNTQKPTVRKSTSPSKPPMKTTKPVAPNFRTSSRFDSKSTTTTRGTFPTIGSKDRSTTVTKPRSPAKLSGSSPSQSGSTTPTKTKTGPTPRSSTAAAVTARLSKPKRPTTGLRRDGSNSSLASEASVSSSTSTTTRRPTKPVTSPTAKPTERPSSATTSSTRTRHSAEGTSGGSSASPFVRGTGTRATMPASVLRTNKKAAAESREARDLPVPPTRTTSIRVTDRLSAPKRVAPEPYTSRTSINPQSPMTRRANPSLNTGKTKKPSTLSPTAGDVAKARSVASKDDHPKPKTFHAVTGSQSRPSDPLRKKTLSPRSPSSQPVTSSEKTKSPSFIKKIIDKSKERKSPLNKSPEQMSKSRKTVLSA